MEKGETHPLCIARWQHNLTIGRLAEEAKVGASTVWRAEHNYSINAESRRRLCTYFNMAPGELGLLSHLKSCIVREQKPPKRYSFEELHPPLCISEKVPAVALPLLSEGTGTAQLSIQREQSGAEAVLKVDSLAALLDANWTLDTMLDALRIVFQGVEGLPTRLQHILLLGMLARKDALVLMTSKHISEEERGLVTEALSTGIEQSWQFFHTASPEQMLIISHGLLYLLQQTQVFLSPASCRSFYASITSLIEAASLFHGFYDITPADRAQVMIEQQALCTSPP